MRLTADVLLKAECYLNAVKERELNLRGFKIPVIENLAVLQDQVDVIDLTDNDIRILENMPKMSRVSTLLLISNSITRINMTKETCQNVPNLKNLILTNNKISNFTEIYNIANFKNLECLSMLENPIALQFEYRYYIISKIPSIKYIDFCKVKPKEREEARKWAKSKDGKAFIAQIQADAITINAMTTTVSKTSETPSYNSLPIIQATPTAAPKRRIFTDDEKRQIREAVESATTPAEMDAIEKQIKMGTFQFSMGNKRKAAELGLDEDGNIDAPAAKK